jgi:hypothetical protein
MRLVFSVALTFAVVSASFGDQTLLGEPGTASGNGWQSSWLEFKSPLSFKKGEVLRLRIEGTAQNVVIRFLPVSSSPESRDGIEGSRRIVPSSRVLELRLENDHPNIRQISVHAGRTAWETELGGNNGPARLASVERVTPAKP